MTHEVIVRPTTIDDLPSVTSIYGLEVLHGTASFELEPPGLEEMTRRYERLRANGYPHLVAMLEGKIAGYAYAGPYRPRPAYVHAVESSVYVAQAARGHGIGRCLVQAVIEICERDDRRQMVAIVGDSAHVASIRLHESLGFRHVGTLSDVGYKHERWLDTVILQRLLGRGAETPPGKRSL